MDRLQATDRPIYKDFFELSRKGLIIEAPNGIVDVNKEACKILNESRNKIIGKYFNEFISKNDYAVYKSKLRDLKEKNSGSLSLKLRLYSDLKEEVWVKLECEGKVLNGGIVYYIQIEPLNEEELKAELIIQFASLITEAPEDSILDSTVAALTKLLNVKYAFIGFLNKKGFSIEVQSSSANDKISKNTSYQLESTVCLAVLKNGCIHFDKGIRQHYPDDSNLVKLEAEGFVGVALKNDSGEVIGHVAIMDTKPISSTDFIASLLQLCSGRLVAEINKRKNKEFLFAQKEHYKKVFDNSLESKLVFNYKSDRIIEANDAACKLFMYSKEEFMGLNYEHIKPAKVSNKQTAENQVRKNYEDLKKVGSVRTETLSMKSDGTVFETEVALSVLDWENEIILVSYLDISERKRLERVREIVERRFKNLFDNSFESIIITDLQKGKFIDCNSQALELFRFGRDEFFKLGPLDILAEHQELNQTPKEIVEKNFSQLSNAEKVSLDLVFKKQDNRQFVANVALLPFTEEDAKFSIAVIKDLTEEKAYLESIEVNERRFKSLFENSFEGIIITDIEKLIFVDCNEETLRLFKYTREEFTKLGPMDIMAKEQLHGLSSQDILNETVPERKKGNKISKELRFVKGTGEEFLADVSLLPIINESHRFSIVVVKDLTAQRAYLNNIKENQEFLKTLIDLNPVHIHVKDREGRFVMANESLADFFNTTVSELIGKKSSSYVIKSLDGKDINYYDYEVLKKGEPMEIEMRGFINALGEECWLQSKKIPLFDEKGNVHQVLSVSTDITHRVKSETELQNSNEELQKVNKELDHLVYKASHDLRSPLASILGLVNLLRTEDIGETSTVYIDLIDQQINKLDGFIKDIIDYSRVSRLQDQKSEIQFEKIVNDIFDSLAFHETAMKIEKTVEVNINNPFYSDANKVGLVLRNLISNAVKYSDAQKESPYIKCSISAEKEQCMIIVEDNGIGIEKEQLPKIFEMFHRGTERSKGSGLGLFIVQEALDKLKGRINVESEASKWTRFTVVLNSLG